MKNNYLILFQTDIHSQKGENMSKYLNEAIIGNKNMIATYTGKGELLRMYFPTKDSKQYIDFFHTGVKINSSDLIYLHDDINNTYLQYYDTDTNVLNTEVTNTYFNLKIVQTDYCLINENVLAKKYIFLNEGSIDLDVEFYIHSQLLSDENNMTSCKLIDGGITQYAHDFTFSTFAKGAKVNRHQINDSIANIKRGEIWDKDYIGMSKDSSVSYKIGKISPNEKKEIQICILIDENKNISEIENEIERIKKIDFEKEYLNTKSYWRKYLKKHNGLNLKEAKNSYEEQILEIYKRTILLFPLLTNAETGGVIASPEIDEERTQCGRYAYCWPRDAVFITKAMDILNMNKESEKFYKVFCKKTQSKNGMWEQRFYTDGKLAPCWGYQIDETASVIYGIYEHYKVTKEEKFIKDTFKMCDKAVRFLERYMDNILGTKDESDVVKKEIEETYHTEDREKLPLSYDLWEMNEGVHLYSIASINAAYNAMLKIYEIIEPEYKENRLKLENIHKNIIRIKKQMEVIPKYVSQNLYNEKTKTLKRNLEDDKTDISILGSIYPFEMFGPKEKKVLNTIEKINMTLRTYTGGYLRFEQDSYRGGKNPWPISTLWMAMYYKEIGQKNKAQECIDYIVNSANKHGFIGEQIDNNTMQPNWVIGLAWAHAMFILAIS